MSKINTPIEGGGVQIDTLEVIHDAVDSISTLLVGLHDKIDALLEELAILKESVNSTSIEDYEEARALIQELPTSEDLKTEDVLGEEMTPAVPKKRNTH